MPLVNFKSWQLWATRGKCYYVNMLIFIYCFYLYSYFSKALLFVAEMLPNQSYKILFMRIERIFIQLKSLKKKLSTLLLSRCLSRLPIRIHPLILIANKFATLVTHIPKDVSHFFAFTVSISKQVLEPFEWTGCANKWPMRIHAASGIWFSEGKKNDMTRFITVLTNRRRAVSNRINNGGSNFANTQCISSSRWAI